MDYKERALKFALEYGNVFPYEGDYYSDKVTNFYGRGVEPSDRYALRELKNKLARGVRVDVDKSIEPFAHTADLFAGTFSPTTEFTYMRGVLVLEDNSKYTIAYYDDELTLSKIMQALDNVSDSWNDIL